MTLDYATGQLTKIQIRIESAAKKSGRPAGDVSLVGASKMQPTELIRDFHAAGLRAVGENYLQEAIDKQQSLADLKLDWHFIGKVQSNKTRLLAQNFDWVQGVDRLKIARRLSSQRQLKTPLQVLIQLNIDQQASKAGVSLQQVSELSAQVAELPNLSLRGFMLIPEPRSNLAEQAETFALAKSALQLTNQRFGLNMDTLSMGMSNDLEVAIQEGSTMIRIGTDLFGARA